jgi:hypothetical protein
MGTYRINKSPTISDGADGILALTEVRVCLGCARPADIEKSPCPYCGDPHHTRTVLICHVATLDNRPKVQIRNLGND